MKINELLTIGVLLMAAVLFTNIVQAADHGICKQPDDEECLAGDVSGGVLFARAGNKVQGRFILLKDELFYAEFNDKQTTDASRTHSALRTMPSSLIGAVLALIGVVAVARRNSGTHL
ncbi:MAG: hypothetical protein ACR2RB_02675 [Gammaproteobacteria bacterium]